MKKQFMSFILAFLAIVSFTSGAFATEDILISEYDSVGNIYLEEYDADNFLEKLIEQSYLSIDGEIIKDATIEGESQLLSKIDYSDGSSKSFFSADLSVGIDFDETVSSDGTITASPRANFTKSDSSDYNFSSNVKITVTITYETGTMASGAPTVNYIKLTNVSAYFLCKILPVE